MWVPCASLQTPPMTPWRYLKPLSTSLWPANGIAAVWQDTVAGSVLQCCTISKWRLRWWSHLKLCRQYIVAFQFWKHTHEPTSGHEAFVVLGRWTLWEPSAVLGGTRRCSLLFCEVLAVKSKGISDDGFICQSSAAYKNEPCDPSLAKYTLRTTWIRYTSIAPTCEDAAFTRHETIGRRNGLHVVVRWNPYRMLSKVGVL
jgi:hypothetical protein